MEMSTKSCFLCQRNITDKTYRSLTSQTTIDLYFHVFTVLGIAHKIRDGGFLCSSCMSRLNKLNKLNKDIDTKVQILENDRDTTLQQLKLLPGVAKAKDSTTKLKTPSPSKLKRPYSVVKQTPTPKSKLKKCLFSSPLKSKMNCRKRDQSTQTKDFTEDFDVKVIVRYAGNERHKIITEDHMKAALKAILNKSTPRAIIGHLSNDKLFKQEILQFIVREVKVEVEQIIIQKDIFQGHASGNYDLLHFDLKHRESRLKATAPHLYNVLLGALKQDKKDCVANLVTAAAVLLYGRSQKQNQLQYILGLVMDRCGVTKEGLQILHDLGIVVSTASIQKKKKQLVKQQEKEIVMVTSYKEYVEGQSKAEIVGMDHDYCNYESPDTCIGKKHIPFEVLGDNLDITVSPSKMTLKNQNKSLHWFLLLLKQKRVVVDDACIISTEDWSKKDIQQVPCWHWLPSKDTFSSLVQNLVFHVAKILLAYVESLKPNEKSFPKYIDHKHLEHMKEKTKFLNCDLLDASENSSQGMIEILQKVHEVSVPHLKSDEEHNTIVEKVVFGGDVLTNERAFSAQMAMQNTPNKYEALLGVIHRPEGLHRLMNFTLLCRKFLYRCLKRLDKHEYFVTSKMVRNENAKYAFKLRLKLIVNEWLCEELFSAIYQTFYKEKSASDKGSLYQIRNLINRRNVTGPDDVVQKYRSHQQFMDDVTDAYVIAAFLDLFEMENTKSNSSHFPLFSLMNEGEIAQWLSEIALKVLDMLKLTEFDSFSKLADDVTSLENDEQNLEAMHIDDKYSCAMCGSQYTNIGWFRKHLHKKHQWKFHSVASSSSGSPSDNPVSCFLFMSLLIRDTYDSYRMGDGDRIIRNAHFEWLYLSALGHTKYKIWLFRMMAYVKGLLSPKQAYEYKWNMTVNLNGGTGQNIANDNCVEIQVHKIKTQLQTQGSNKCFQSAKDIVMTSQVVQGIQEQLMKTANTCKGKRSRPMVNRTNDIETIVEFIRKSSDISKLNWPSFKDFKDPIKRVQADKLHEWIKHQKRVANEYLTE